MKTIEQLLELSKNPYYKFTAEEENELNNFLFKKREKALKKATKKSSKQSDKSTRVTAPRVKVRNVVEKTVTGVEESGQ